MLFRSTTTKEGTHLEHVGQETEDRVEALELLLLVGAVGDAGKQLGEKAEIDDEGGSEERVLALVEDVLFAKRKASVTATERTTRTKRTMVERPPIMISE